MERAGRFETGPYDARASTIVSSFMAPVLVCVLKSALVFIIIHVARRLPRRYAPRNDGCQGRLELLKSQNLIALVDNLI